MTVGLERVVESETRWGRAWWRSSLIRKHPKKQPIALETDLSRNPTTDLHTNPSSRFHNQHTMDNYLLLVLLSLFFFFFLLCLNSHIRANRVRVVGSFLKFELRKRGKGTAPAMKWVWDSAHSGGEKSNLYSLWFGDFHFFNYGIGV